MAWYRRSRHLVCYWEDGLAVLHNYRSGRRVAANDDVLRILSKLDDWTAAARLTRIPGVSFRQASAAVKWLRDHTLVEHSPRRPPPDKRHDVWRIWGTTAALFHFATRDVHFVADSRDEPDRHALGDGWRIDARRRRYRGSNHSTELPDVRFADVLFERRTWRRFGSAHAPAAALSTVLTVTFGVHAWLRSGHSVAALRTSPSAGARQPLEAYVLVRHVEGVRPGLYRFLPGSCRLKRLSSPRDVAATIRRYLPGQPWYAGASCLVLITAALERTASKYTSPHAYRTILIEAGHFCQTFCLAATALGLAPFCTAALADSAIERDLNVDPAVEPIIYAAGFGTRPRGRTSGRAPKGETEPRVDARSVAVVRSA